MRLPQLQQNASLAARRAPQNGHVVKSNVLGVGGYARTGGGGGCAGGVGGDEVGLGARWATGGGAGFGGAGAEGLEGGRPAAPGSNTAPQSVQVGWSSVTPAPQIGQMKPRKTTPRRPKGSPRSELNPRSRCWSNRSLRPGSNARSRSEWNVRSRFGSNSSRLAIRPSRRSPSPRKRGSRY